VVNESRSARYDTADYLTTAESIQDYLNAALEDGDERVLLRALRHVAEKKGGLSQLARETGLARESLSRALKDDGNPRFSSLIVILRAMGLELAVRARDAA
jgi:probable addiction module antidote protein